MNNNDDLYQAVKIGKDSINYAWVLRYTGEISGKNDIFQFKKLTYC